MSAPVVRAKFRVHSVEDFGQSKTVKLGAVCADEIEENQRYHRYTPFGELKMTIDNPAASERFEEGKTFYLDFVEVKDGPDA